MNTLLLAVIVIVGVVLFLVLARGTGGSSEFPYQLSKYLFSNAERSFYGVLVQAIGSSGLVFSKVRLADVIAPKKGMSRSDWQRAFNAISSKHLDFVVCDPGDCSIKLAVELDDSSHGSAKAQKRDKLLNGACESAGLPLLRIKAAKSYVIADIQRLVQEAISPSHEALAAPVQSIVAEQAAPASPPFAKCGEAMVLRKAKSGANVGQEFWGCSTFPKCRAVVKSDTEQITAADD